MDPIAPLTALVDVLGGSVVRRALLAGAIIGLTLGVILLARFGDMWTAMRARRGTETLQASLIAMVAANRATEDALRRRLDEAERDRAVTREELDETRAQLALLRHQRRRLITMMREVVARLPEPAVRVRERRDVTGLQLTDAELAVLIAVVLAIVVALVLIVRRFGPAPICAMATTSSAVPADLAAIELRIKAVEGRVSEPDHGINQVRTMLNALPTKDSVHGIALKVAELQGDLKVNNSTTAATAKSIERIEEWILRLDEKATTR